MHSERSMDSKLSYEAIFKRCEKKKSQTLSLLVALVSANLAQCT